MHRHITTELKPENYEKKIYIRLKDAGEKTDKTSLANY